MKNRFLIFITFFLAAQTSELCILNCFAQNKRENVWVTGTSGNTVDFNNVIITKKGLYFPFKFFGVGSSCISDTDGQLLLVSDGFNLYNNYGGGIQDGDTLIPNDYYVDYNGYSTGSQTSIILPMDSGIYYFITPTYSDARFADCLANNNCYFDLLLYNLIDMKANGGAGQVVQRMIPLMQNARLRKTQMMACKHGNGKDWWLLKNEGDSANVHTFLFTQDSVYDKGVQVLNEPVWGTRDMRGQSTFNSDGSMFATTSHGSSAGKIFIADFDRCHGLLSKPYLIQMPWGSQHDPSDTTIKERLSVGLSFSPNNQFLYVISMSNIYQYDLSDSTWFHVAGLDTTYLYFNDYDPAYLAPDNKIYIGNFGGGSKQMSRIDNPDVKGAGCNFCPRCLRLDSLGLYGYAFTPPCMPNYSLGAKVCYPLDTQDIDKNDELVVYPNPTNSELHIKYKESRDTKLQIINMLGVVIKEITLSKDVQHVLTTVGDFAQGVYVYRQIDGKEILNTGKLVITN